MSSGVLRTGNLVVLRTGRHAPPGQLTAEGWAAVRSAPVWCALADHPQRMALEAAGIGVSVLGGLDEGETPVPSAEAIVAQAPLVWLADPGEPGMRAADAEVVAELIGTHGADQVVGSTDPPFAAMLDAVAVMDRLRSPGGCPWDAEQTHTTLMPYLLEEAYEAYQALEDGDLAELRDELGDVLLQVLFHGRIAEEDAGWSVDDVAAGLVAKLVRRHPHVFASRTVSGAAEVQANWDEIKAAEQAAKRDSAADVHPVERVPLALPALTLASKLQSRAAKAGLRVEDVEPTLGAAETPEAAVASMAAELLDGDQPPTVDRVGALLFAVVALARAADVDPEAALRGAARRYRDRVTELASRVSESRPARLDG